MRNILSTIVFLGLLCSCSTKKTSQKKEYNYDDYESIQISYSEVFDKTEESYLVYFYSEYCGYCQSIKEEVLSFVDGNYFPIYLCHDTDNFLMGYEYEQSIGCQTSSCLIVCGTPSLIRIENHKIVLNACGVNSVLAYLSFYSD